MAAPPVFLPGESQGRGSLVVETAIRSKYTILQKATALHSSTLAWEIPWTEEPGRLQSMGSLGVGHN